MYQRNLLRYILLFGSLLLEWTQNSDKTMEDLLGSRPVLLVSDPEFLRIATIKEFASLTNRQLAPVTGTGIFRCALISSRDDHWKHMRSSLTPTFTTGKLKMMMPLIEHCSDHLVEHIRKANGEPFAVKEFMGGYTMDVIASTAFGIEVDSQKNPDSPFLKYGKSFLGDVDKGIGMWRKIKMAVSLILMLIAPDELIPILEKLGTSVFDGDAVEYFVDIVNKILENRTIDENGKKDFVQLCMDQLVEATDGDPDTHYSSNDAKWTSKGLTKDDIVANALLFLMAGFETTATSLQYCFYETVMSEGVQEKIFKEIRASTTSDSPSYEEISNMTYLDWCVQETLRLYPAGLRFNQHVTKRTTINDITLPEDSVLTVMTYAVHHDPEIWPDPEEFIPERFSPENKEGRHPCAWIPFGIGNRNCIGMRLALLQIKMAIIKVLWNYKLEKCDDIPVSCFDTKVTEMALIVDICVVVYYICC